MRVRAAAVTRRGAGRPVNQDAVAVAGWLSQAVDGPTASVETETGTGRSVACVVADGLGGHPAGEVASLLAVRDITANADAMTCPQDLTAALRTLSADIEAAGTRSPKTAGMRTTVVGLVVGSDHVLGFSVGDSPLFDVIEGRLFPISIPDRPVLPAADGPDVRGTVSQCLGSPHGVNPHVWALPADEPRRYVLCSDGITNYADRAALERGLADRPDPARAAEALLAAAVDGGTIDDATVVVVDLLPADRGSDEHPA